jgi:hypothetical protein
MAQRIIFANSFELSNKDRLHHRGKVNITRGKKGQILEIVNSGSFQGLFHFEDDRLVRDV